jgi:putative oxidoreductase
MQKSGSPSSWLASTDGIAAQWQDLLLLLARVLFGWTFVMSGWGKLMNISGFIATMPRRGLPDFLGYAAPFVEFIGGVLLVVGLATRYASLVMLLFIIIAAFSSHRYWAVESAQVANQSAHFWKRVDDGRRGAVIHHRYGSLFGRRDASTKALGAPRRGDHVNGGTSVFGP